MAESLFKRILRGSTGPKNDPKEDEKSDTPAPPEKKAALVENALKVGLTRRGVLGGAATSAASIASNQTISQAPVIIQQGIKEAAALLAPRIHPGGFHFVSYVQDFNTSHEYKERKFGSYSSKDEYVGTGEFSPTIEDTFSKGAPLTNKGNWAHQQFFQISWLSRLNLPQALKLGDLKNSEILSEAYRLAGVELPKEGNVAKNVQDALGVLQRVTGVSDEQTVGDLEKVYGSRIVDIAKKVLDDPKFFPAKTLGQMSSDERVRHETALRYLEDTIKHSRLQVDPSLSERIQGERKVYREFHDERDKQREAEKQAEKAGKDKAGEERRLAENRQIEKEEAARKREREEFNDKIKGRESIESRVQLAVRESRDDPNARVFIITPRRYEGIGDFHGLTRMHIQHLRQQLTVGARGKGLKNPTLDSFDPATTKVEEIGNTVRVSTTDAKFQKYLKLFADDSYKRLEIPNRLQMVVPPEKEES